MAHGRRHERWDHTAAQLTLFANSNRRPGGRKFQLSDFHPYLQAAPRGMPINADTIDLLIEALVPPERRVTRPEGLP